MYTDMASKDLKFTTLFPSHERKSSSSSGSYSTTGPGFDNVPLNEIGYEGLAWPPSSLRHWSKTESRKSERVRKLICRGDIWMSPSLILTSDPLRRRAAKRALSISWSEVSSLQRECYFSFNKSEVIISFRLWNEFLRLSGKIFLILL